MALNVKGLKTLAQLQKAKAALARRERDLREASIKQTKAKIDGILAEEGLRIDEVYPLMHRRKRSLKPKYANPENRSQTWSGLGKRPHWVVDHLAGGGELYDLAI